MKNRIWELTRLHKKQSPVGCKWIFKKKEGIPIIEEPRFKERLVVNGFTSLEGGDYNEIFSLILKYCSIRVLMEIINQYNLELDRIDVKTTFLHGCL